MREKSKKTFEIDIITVLLILSWILGAGLIGAIVFGNFFDSNNQLEVQCDLLSQKCDLQSNTFWYFSDVETKHLDQWNSERDVAKFYTLEKYDKWSNKWQNITKVDRLRTLEAHKLYQEYYDKYKHLNVSRRLNGK